MQGSRCRSPLRLALRAVSVSRTVVAPQKRRVSLGMIAMRDEVAPGAGAPYEPVLFVWGFFPTLYWEPV